MKINAIALGYALALVSAIIMLVLGILGNLGWYLDGVAAMQQWHLFFSLSFWGVVAGIIEGAIGGFVLGWLTGWAYGLFETK